MTRRRRPSPDRDRIREVFLAPQPSYDQSGVAGLLGIPESTVRDALAGGTISAIGGGPELRIAWEDVVALGLEHRWTYRMLTEALRGVDAPALPPLVRVVPRRVVLPRFQWDALRLLAERRASDERREITASDLLEEATSGFLSATADWDALETSIPGLRAAAAWPTTE